LCGFAGFAGAGDRDDLWRMMERLGHRGPDAAAAWVDSEARVYLGHRRLTIRDAVGGGQPMWNEDHTVCIVFNGEIYNHDELRAALTARGHVFRSGHSDTEVVLHGYEEWREALPGRINGMFAFAIFDSRAMRLFLACDRFGEKPVFYAERSDAAGFAFASEPRALLAHRGIDRTVDVAALQKLLAYGYLPAPLTLHAGIRKLPGGSWLDYGLRTDTVRTHKYWRFTMQPEAPVTGEAALAEELEHHLRNAVRRRQISDVPVGYLLSGGVDSGSIVGLAARGAAPGSLGTFTLAIDDGAFDESGEAAALAAHFGTRHHVERWGAADVARTADEVAARLGEPIVDMTILPTVALCRLARKHVKVALSGEGGDEMFAGYPQFGAMAAARRYRAYMPGPLKAAMRQFSALLPTAWFRGNGGDNFKRGIAGLSHGAALWNPIWLSALLPREISRLFDQPLDLPALYDEAIATWFHTEGAGIGDRTVEYFANLYLPNNLLPRIDQASMMVSLESRAVMLDNDLVEFSTRLPYHYKWRGKVGKYLLKQAMRPILPAAVLDRPKRGFDLPLGRWLPLDRFGAASTDLPGVRRDVLRRFEREHHAGRADHSRLFWALTVADRLTRGADAEAPRAPWRAAAETRIGSGIASQFVPSVPLPFPA
jgi:asparagine synthase (glutamine-hydrolysing)